jgi:hypothetical protein
VSSQNTSNPPKGLYNPSPNQPQSSNQSKKPIEPPSYSASYQNPSNTFVLTDQMKKD